MKFVISLLLNLTFLPAMPQHIIVCKQDKILRNDMVRSSGAKKCRIINLIKPLDTVEFRDSILVTLKIFPEKTEILDETSFKRLPGHDIDLDSLFNDSQKMITACRMIDISDLNNHHFEAQNFWVDSVIYIQTGNKEITKISGQVIIEYYWIAYFKQTSILQTNQTTLNLLSKPLNINFDDRTATNKAYSEFFDIEIWFRSAKLFLNKILGAGLYEFYRNHDQCKDCGLEETTLFFVYKPGFGIVSFKGKIPEKGMFGYQVSNEEYDFR
jgi:hypothetical protein